MPNAINIANHADVLAIPFFILAVRYFHQKPQRTPMETILYYFVIVALLFDSYSAYLVFR